MKSLREVTSTILIITLILLCMMSIVTRIFSVITNLNAVDDMSNEECYRCQDYGHYAYECELDSERES